MRSLHVISIAGAFAVAMPILAQAQRPTVSMPGRTGTGQACTPIQVIKKQCVPANARTQTGRYPSGTVYPQRRPTTYPQQQYPVYPQQYPNYPNYPSYPSYPNYPQSSNREVILPDGQRCMEHMDGTGRVHYNCPQAHGNSRGHGNGKWKKEDHDDDHDRRARDSHDSRESHESHASQDRSRSGGYRRY